MSKRKNNETTDDAVVLHKRAGQPSELSILRERNIDLLLNLAVSEEELASCLNDKRMVDLDLQEEKRKNK